MPGITSHHCKEVLKLLLIGASGSGKTGALVSLAAAGYNLRVLDLDNGMDIVKDFVVNPKSPYKVKDPDARIRYLTLTDSMEDIGGKIFPKKATVWQRVTSTLKNWKDDDGVELGGVLSWGPKEVLVIDSLSMLANAALWYHLQMNGALRGDRTTMERRRDFGSAQGYIRNLLQLLYDKEVKCNVIVTSHITYNTDEGLPPVPDKDGVVPPKEGFPAAIGRALGPEIPRYFNTMLVARTRGMGQGMKHVLSTVSIDNVKAKSSAPLRVKPEYSIDTGLADYFSDVLGSTE